MSSTPCTDEALVKWSDAVLALTGVAAAQETISLERIAQCLTESGEAVRRGAQDADRAMAALMDQVRAVAATSGTGAPIIAPVVRSHDTFIEAVPMLLQSLTDLQGRVAAVNDLWSKRYEALRQQHHVETDGDRAPQDLDRIMDETTATTNLRRRYEDACARIRRHDSCLEDALAVQRPPPPPPPPPPPQPPAVHRDNKELDALRAEITRLQSALSGYAAQGRSREDIVAALKSDVQALTFENGVLCEEVNRLLCQRKKAPVRSSDLALFGSYVVPQIDVVFREEDDAVNVAAFTYGDVGTLVHRHAELTRKLFAATTQNQSRDQTSAATPKKRNRDDDENTTPRKKGPPHHPPVVTTADAFVQVVPQTVSAESLRSVRDVAIRDSYLEAMQAVYVGTLLAQDEDSDDCDPSHGVNFLATLQHAAERLAAEALAHSVTTEELRACRADLDRCHAAAARVTEERMETAVGALGAVVALLAGHVMAQTQGVTTHVAQAGHVQASLDGTARTLTATFAALQEMSSQWVSLTNELHDHQQSLLQKKATPIAQSAESSYWASALRAENVTTHEQVQRLQTSLMEERQRFIDTMQNVWQVEERAQQQVIAAQSVEVRLSAAHQERKGIADALSAVQLQHDQLSGRFEEKSRAFDALQSQAEALRSEVSGLREEERAAAELRGTVANLTERLQESERVRELCQGEVDRLEGATSQCRDLESRLGQVTQTRVGDLIETGVLTRDDVVMNLNSRLTDLSTEHAALSFEVSSLRPKCASLQSQCESLQKALDKERSQCTFYRTSLAAAKEKSSEAAADVVLQLRQRCSQMEEETQSAKAAETMAKARAQHLEGGAERMELLLQSYKEKLDVLSNTEETAPVRECGTTLAAYLRDQTAKATRAAADAERRLLEVTKATSGMETDLARRLSLTQEESLLKSTLMSSLEQKLQQVGAEVGELRQRDAEGRRAGEAKSAKINELEVVSAAVRDRAQTQTAQITQKDTHIASLEDEVKKLKADNVKLNKLSNTMKAKLEAANGKLEKANAGGFGVGF